MVRRGQAVRLNIIFRVRILYGNQVILGAENAEPEPDLEAPEPPSPALDRWRSFVERVNENDATAARSFIVQRARRIWGCLGLLLRRAAWAQAFRAANFIPIRVLTYVKRWLPAGGAWAGGE